MTPFRIDLVSVVFVLAVINLAAPLFVVAHGQLTQTNIRLGNFIAAKAAQGISWLLRLYWFVHPDPVFSMLSDLFILTGFALESALLVNFARPIKRHGQMVYLAVYLGLCVAASLSGLVSVPLRNLIIFLGFMGLLDYAAFRLYFAPDAGRFQKLIAILYSTVPLAQAVMFVIMGDEVAKPGYSQSVGGLFYYSLLILMQVVGSLGYLLMIKERDTAILREQATHDALTGMLNRRAFFEMAGTLLAIAARNGESMAVIIADMDRFKQINDRRGHQTGDQVLVAFANSAMESIRQGDICARFGGDEFVLCLPNSDRAVAETVARRLQDNLQTQLRQAAPPLPPCTISIGICSGSPAGPTDLQQFLAKADEGLYAAKQAGRNRWEWRSLPNAATDSTPMLTF